MLNRKAATRFALMASMLPMYNNKLYLPEPRMTAPDESIKHLPKSKLERFDDLINELDELNEKGVKNKHWSLFEVNKDILVYAYNLKNARKTFDFLLRKHNLTYQPASQNVQKEA